MIEEEHKDTKISPAPAPTNSMNISKEPDVINLEDSEDSEEWEEIEGTQIPVTDCLFCDRRSVDMLENVDHMSVVHSFFIPDFEYCVDIEGLLEYLGSKVGEGMVCLWCNDKGRQYYSLDAVQVKCSEFFKYLV